MSETTVTLDVAEAAMCLFEAELDSIRDERIEKHLHSVGISEFRMEILTDSAPKLEAAYQKATKHIGEFDNPFDMEFVPSVLSEVLEMNNSPIASQEIWERSANKVVWLHNANAYMRRNYGISIDDTGIDDDEFYQRFGDGGATDYDSAVEIHAEKYDLDRLR